jgi:LuxR family maltose regulon positive regulatory protein
VITWRRARGSPTPPRSAKTSLPRIANVVPRERLFRALDRARRQPIVWIQAPPGAGKTALLASWIARRKLRALWITLDPADDAARVLSLLSGASRAAAAGKLPPFRPEHLADPGEFARRLFSAISAQRSAPEVIVLDDYHEVGPGSLLHAALRDGVGQLGQGTSLVVASRGAPPPAMARLRASGALELVPASSLVLTAAEARAVARARSPRRPPSPAALRVAEGWAAGVVLIAAAASDRAEPSARRGVFEYLGAEVLERVDPRTRSVLLLTSILPTVTAEAARSLGGDERAAEILEDFARLGWFTHRLPGSKRAFRYHDLFREFLVARLRAERTPDELTALSRRAAELLAGDGDVDSALTLLAAAEVWDDFVGLLLSHAPALVAAGRSEALARWIERVPPGAAEHRPWLAFFGGIARFHADPSGAVGALERAHAEFVRSGDAVGAYRSWAAATDMQFYALEDVSSLGRRLDELEVLRKTLPIPDPATEAAVVASAFVAYANLRATDPRMREWEDRALAIALSPGDPRARLGVGRQLVAHLTYWGADVTRARTVLEALEPLATAKDVDLTDALIWHLGESALHDYAGDGARARRVVDRGLALAERSGIHLWDSVLWTEKVFGALELEDFASAQRDLAALSATTQRASRIGHALWHYSVAALAFRRGEHGKALERARVAVRLAKEAGHPMVLSTCEITSAVAAARGGGAGPTVEEARANAERVGFAYGEIGASLFAAAQALARGDEEAAAAALAEVLPRARRTGCTNVVWVGRADMAELCALALERGIEPEFARHVVTARALAPGPRARTVAAWPWRTRVEALGRLEVIHDGQPSTAAKSQKKPLELLTLLVASGARGARVAAVAEALWPDADGDTAHHALETTAYRLRRMLGDPAAVVHRGGRLALDPARVFVDAWAFEALAARADALRAAGAVAPALRCAAGAGALYAGELFGDEEHPLVSEPRARLAARHRRLSAAGS